MADKGGGFVTLEFQRKIYETYKANHDETVKKGRYEYSIAHNAVASIHTWIVRKKVGDEIFHWYQPLDKAIK